MKRIDWKQKFTELHCSFEMSQKLDQLLGLDPTQYSLSFDKDGELGDGAYLQELEKADTEKFYPALNMVEAMVLFYGVVPTEPEILIDQGQYIVRCGYWETKNKLLVDAICEMYIHLNTALN